MNAKAGKLALARSLILVATALLSCATDATESGAPGSTYVPSQYQPKSKRDFTGLWQTRDGIGWIPGIPPGPKQNPPLTPEYRKIFEKRLRDADIGKPTGDTTAACLPQGMPRIMTMVYPMEIMQNEIQLNIFAEWEEQTRRIFIDGRPHPPADEIDPTYYGHSIGHWEGDVLVGETVGVRGDTTLESSGLPHSDQLTVQERIWLADSNTLKDQITLEDPKAYTRPWTVTKTYHRAPAGFTLLPYVCLENQRNPIGNDGVTGFIHEGAPTDQGTAAAPKAPEH